MDFQNTDKIIKHSDSKTVRHKKIKTIILAIMAVAVMVSFSACSLVAEDGDGANNSAAVSDVPGSGGGKANSGAGSASDSDLGNASNSGAGKAAGAGDISGSGAGKAAGSGFRYAAGSSATAEPGLGVPAYSGSPYAKVNKNKPKFDGISIQSGRAARSFEKYGKLDGHGRCTLAMASLSEDTQPGTYEERGDISQIHPSGWRSGQRWERCHLIGWQLCAENANPRNLITGTHYMNVSGMLPFENRIDNYLERTGNHVLYEVTPVYHGKNQIASGVHMQAKSVEDKGRGISFNVYCYNISPGNTINYRTGEVSPAGNSNSGTGKSYSGASSGTGKSYSGSSSASGKNYSGAKSSSSGSKAGSNSKKKTNSNSSGGSFKRKYVVNTNTGKFHYPSCSSAKLISDHNRWIVKTSRKTLIYKGYEPCGLCEP